MNIKTIVGLILVIGGSLSFAYRGIPYTSEEELVNIGPLRAKAQTEKTFAIHPAISIAVAVGGIVLVLWGARPK